MQLTKELIQQEYVDGGKSFYQIGEECGTHAQNVRRFAIKAGFTPRTKKESTAAALKSGRLKHPTAGTKRDAGTVKKIASTMAQTWKDLTKDELADRIKKSQEAWNRMTDEQKTALQRSAMEACRSAAKTGSKAEKYMEEILVAAGYRVECHKKHIIANQNVHIDLFLPELSVAVEINGPSHYYPIFGEEQLQKTIGYDQKKVGLLMLEGITLVKVGFLGDPCISRCQKIGEELLATLQKFKENGPEKDCPVIRIGEK